MKLNAYCVYDSKSLSYGMPMFINAVGAAIRAFTDVANEEGSAICKHPSDYVLYEIGYFDDSTGVFTMHSPVKNLGNASEYKKVAKAPVVYQPAAAEPSKK